MKIRILLIIAAVAFVASCNDYLDELPDNRTEIKNLQNVNDLLVTAYPSTAPIFLSEMSSDNVDDYGSGNPNTTMFCQQVYRWEEISELDNESPEQLWESSYASIATANIALEALQQLNDNSAAARQAKGEALLCRAYNHFVLANIFCQAYNSKTSRQDLGLVYMDHSTQHLDFNQERGTVEQLYDNMERDLTEGLSLVGSNYDVPKYHFNERAAYAFACRFFLYREQWDKALQYANLCLGSEPATMLRDWKHMSAMTQTYEALTNHYIDVTVNSNLMLVTAYSSMGIIFGPFRALSRFAHGRYLSEHETAQATKPSTTPGVQEEPANIWGSAHFFQEVHAYRDNNLDKTIFFKLPYLFESTDPVNGTGFYRTVYPAFTTDECLLNRAEALTLLGRYDEAASDLTLWMQNIVNTTDTLTPAIITEHYNAVSYSYDDDGMNSTIKKHLHPKFDIGAEGDTTECMLQCVLGFRRLESLQAGLRWYDVKRYGIEVVRRTMGADGNPVRVTDVLKTDDPRRAIQIPTKVRDAGVQANPR